MTTTEPPPPFLWNLLLGLIAERKVIPIVGQDLLRIEVDGRSVLLYRHLAERLAASLGVEAPSPNAANPLHEVAAWHLKANGDSDTIYYTLCELMNEVIDLPVPEPLRKLAEIRKLRLFLTTTFDPFLQRALDEVRYDGEPRTNVLSFMPTNTGDIELPLADSGTTVFHLFGKISYAAEEYAVHEDDVVEFMSALQSTSSRPTKLFQELGLRHLLFIGSGFDDWLTRFFIRSVRQKRLWFLTSPNGFVADDRMRDEIALRRYLSQSKCVKLFEHGGPVEFVDELHRQWMKRESEVAAEKAANPNIGEIVDGCIFVSYAGEDRAAAEKIVGALRAINLDVFYDQTNLRSGDAFGPMIQLAIERSAAFVPVISQRAIADGPRYVKREWKHGVEQSNFYGPTEAYVLPIVVDETAYDDARVPDHLRQLTWYRMPASGPEETWVQRVRTVVRKNRNNAK